MITLLSRRFPKDMKNTQDPRVRRFYGMLCGALGVVLNCLLSLGKFLVGVFCGSISVTADALNNLLDAASCAITLVGFHMAGQKPDPDHPFGHGRIEYVSGFLVSILTLFTMVELAKSSLEKIVTPDPPVFSPLSFWVLSLSIFVKCVMFLYNRRLGKRFDAPAMKAAAIDSLSDALVTALVLGSALLSRFTSFTADGWCGLILCLFIGYAGLDAAKNAVSPLLGQAPDKDFVRRVNRIVLSYPKVLGIHDLMVHNYGPSQVLLSLHAEVPAQESLVEIHELIDAIERRLGEELNCQALIHMDPVQTGDRETDRLRALAKACARQVDPSLTIHDFRITQAPQGTKLIFDVAAPYACPLSDQELAQAIREQLSQAEPGCEASIAVDRQEI